jgi:hypothetical protein
LISGTEVPYDAMWSLHQNYSSRNICYFFGRAPIINLCSTGPLVLGQEFYLKQIGKLSYVRRHVTEDTGFFVALFGAWNTM